MLIENFSQYPAMTTWNIVGIGNFWQSLRRLNLGVKNRFRKVVTMRSCFVLQTLTGEVSGGRKFIMESCKGFCFLCQRKLLSKACFNKLRARLHKKARFLSFSFKAAEGGSGRTGVPEKCCWCSSRWEGSLEGHDVSEGSLGSEREGWHFWSKWGGVKVCIVFDWVQKFSKPY